jgi:arylsulfatase A-like enzyme
MAAVQAAGRSGRANRPPNVLLIVADEWRAQATHYNGDPNVRTPALDRLFAQSVSFDCAISGNPVCCPFRASLMTGQYPLTNGVFINDVELKPTGTTLAEAFGKAGYQTGFIGKWHVYGSPDGNYGRRLAFVPVDKRLGFTYWKGAECSHEYNHSLYFEGSDSTPRYWPGYDAFSQTDDACAFIEKRAKAPDPWFLMLSLGPPHFPYETAPARYQAMFKDAEIHLRPNVPAEKRAKATEILRGYYAHMAALDSCFERLLKTLDRFKVGDDTVVVFTSDHGDMMLSQGLTTKLYPWDESIRVPFLVRYPRARTAPPISCPPCCGSAAYRSRAAWKATIIPVRLRAQRCPAWKPPRWSICRSRLPKPAGMASPNTGACARSNTRMSGRSTVPGCSTITGAILTRCITCAGAVRRGNYKTNSTRRSIRN